MLWKALGILTMLCSSCTLMWVLWTIGGPFRVAFWVIIGALVICMLVVIKGKISG